LVQRLVTDAEIEVMIRNAVNFYCTPEERIVVHGWLDERLLASREPTNPVSREPR